MQKHLSGVIKIYKQNALLYGMRKILVSDIMTRGPITVRPETNVLECAKKMVQKKVGSLLITDKKKLVGFISQSDIMWAVTKKPNGDLSKVKAVDISPKKIAIIKPECSVQDALEKMKKLKFERLPVIQDGQLVGMITIKDILNFHPEIYPELEEFAKIREESEKLKRIKQAEKRTDGICEECGHEGTLFKVNGMLICESCRGAI